MLSGGLAMPLEFVLKLCIFLLIVSAGLIMFNPKGMPRFLGQMALMMVLIASMKEVQALSMEQIAFLTGGHLSQQTSISLRNRNLDGPIPPELGSLTNLTSLDLSNNKLSGSIPPEIGISRILRSLAWPTTSFQAGYHLSWATSPN
jgi:hypothetical protein